MRCTSPSVCGWLRATIPRGEIADGGATSLTNPQRPPQNRVKLQARAPVQAQERGGRRNRPAARGKISIWRMKATKTIRTKNTWSFQTGLSCLRVDKNWRLGASPAQDMAAVIRAGPTQRSGRSQPDQSISRAAPKPTAAAPASRRVGPGCRAAQAAPNPQATRITGPQPLGLDQYQYNGISQGTRRSHEARNGTNHQPLTARAAAPVVTAQRVTCRNEAPLVADSTTQITIHPGIIVKLHSSATPATAPAAIGR